MISIGIDQSYTSTGYCIIEEDILDYGIIKTDKDMDIHDRVTKITDNLIEIISKYPNSQITIEGLAFGIRGNATRDLAGLQFVIIHNLKRHLKNFEVVAPTSLKKFATGSGGGKKKITKADMFKALPEDIQKLFKSTHKISTGLYDITDAYWLAKYTK